MNICLFTFIFLSVFYIFISLSVYAYICMPNFLFFYACLYSHLPLSIYTISPLFVFMFLYISLSFSLYQSTNLYVCLTTFTSFGFVLTFSLKSPVFSFFFILLGVLLVCCRKSLCDNNGICDIVFFFLGGGILMGPTTFSPLPLGPSQAWPVGSRGCYAARGRWIRHTIFVDAHLPTSHICVYTHGCLPAYTRVRGRASTCDPLGSCPT